MEVTSTKSLWDQVYENQTVLVVGGVVLLHLLGVAILMGFLWSESPKSVPHYKLAKAERELYKHRISKKD